jgi:hypothetical protein
MSCLCVVLESALPGMVRGRSTAAHHSSENGLWRSSPPRRIHHAQVEDQWPPLSCSSCTTSIFCPGAAHISAVSPWLSLALMLAPLSSSSFTTSTLPLEPGHASVPIQPPSPDEHWYRTKEHYRMSFRLTSTFRHAIHVTWGRSNDGFRQVFENSFTPGITRGR